MAYTPSAEIDAAQNAILVRIVGTGAVAFSGSGTVTAGAAVLPISGTGALAFLGVGTVTVSGNKPPTPDGAARLLGMRDFGFPWRIS